MSTPPPSIVSNLVTQLLGVGLTVFGLGFTVAQPVLGRLDLLSTTVARMEAVSQANQATATAQERRIAALEAQVANNREALIRIRGNLPTAASPE